MIFQASDSTSDVIIPISIPINDDDIDEGNEEFVVFVELVDAVDNSRVDLSERNVTLCHLGDNDGKSMLKLSM